MPVIDVDGARVAFAETGRGEPVVLLHCTGGSNAQWQSLAAELQDRFRLLAPDLYGHGGTDPWPGQGPLTLAAEAAIVAALIDQGGAPVHLVGHSYGGSVALRAALEQPERIRSLTLIEPASFHLLADGDVVDELLFDDIQCVAEAVWYATASGDFAGGLECFVDYWSGDGTWAGTRPEAQQALTRCIGAIAQNFWSATTEPAAIDDCRRLAMPALIMCGGRSPATTRRITQLLAEAMPAARLRVIPDAGHMLPLTHRDAVNAAIAEHIAGAATALAQAA